MSLISVMAGFLPLHFNINHEKQCIEKKVELWRHNVLYGPVFYLLSQQRCEFILPCGCASLLEERLFVSRNIPSNISFHVCRFLVKSK